MGGNNHLILLETIKKFVSGESNYFTRNCAVGERGGSFLNRHSQLLYEVETQFSGRSTRTMSSLQSTHFKFGRFLIRFTCNSAMKWTWNTEIMDSATKAQPPDCNIMSVSLREYVCFHFQHITKQDCIKIDEQGLKNIRIRKISYNN